MISTVRCSAPPKADSRLYGPALYNITGSSSKLCTMTLISRGLSQVVLSFPEGALQVGLAPSLPFVLSCHGQCSRLLTGPFPDPSQPPGGLTRYWLHIQVFVFLSVDDHSSSHEWWEEGGNDRGIKLGDRDAGREGHLLNHLCLHRGPKVLHVYLTRAQELRPGELKGQDKKGQTVGATEY